MSKPTKAELVARFKGKMAEPFGKPKASSKPATKSTSRPAAKGKKR